MMSPFVPFSSAATVKESILDPLLSIIWILKRFSKVAWRAARMGLFGSSRPPPHSEVRSKSYRVFRPRQWASLERGAGCPRWVKLRKNSVRAYVFRFALELGHCSMQSACLKGANRRHLDVIQSPRQL